MRRFPGLCALLAVVSCGPKAKDCPSVPDLDQSACSTQTLSYTADIAPIMNDRCMPCHAPGGEESTIPFTTYKQVFSERMSIASQLVGCDMPPDGSPQLTADERKQILDWLSCGAAQ